MRPEELQAKILTVAEYLEGAEKPSRTMAAAAVRTLMGELNHTAAKVTKFVDDDLRTAVQGLDALIKKLNKAAGTLNPQDEAKDALDTAVAGFKGLRDDLVGQYSNLSGVDI